MSLAKRLRRARIEKQLTQRELGERSGVSHPLISQIETVYVRNPGVHTVHDLARALGCKPEWLAWGRRKNVSAR